jgi:hypothetical protein
MPRLATQTKNVETWNENFNSFLKKRAKIATPDCLRAEKFITPVTIRPQGTIKEHYTIPANKIKLQRPGIDYNPYGCVRGYIEGETTTRMFHKVVTCGKENCTVCGQDYSITHNRRIDRSYQKIMQLERVGYMVITVPDSLRDKFLDKQVLNDFRNYVRRKIKREISARGLIRWHWCGDDCVTWKPHLNVLMEKAYIPIERLEQIRKDIAAYFFREFNKAVPGNIYYSYVTMYTSNGKKSTEQQEKIQRKIKHWLNYVLRATAKHVKDTNVLDTIYNYRNTGYFGKFEKTNIERSASSAIMAGCDPDTGEKIIWLRMIKPSEFNAVYKHVAQEICIKAPPNKGAALLSCGVFITEFFDLLHLGAQSSIFDLCKK